jgi:hypothetical protein
LCRGKGGRDGDDQGCNTGEVAFPQRATADPDESGETVQGTIQATLPTAEVGYPEDGAEVVIQIADDEIVSAFVRFGSVRTAGFSRAATAVRPEAVRETLR